jgi:hypothetical protein
VQRLGRKAGEHHKLSICVLNQIWASSGSGGGNFGLSRGATWRSLYLPPGASSHRSASPSASQASLRILPTPLLLPAPAHQRPRPSRPGFKAWSGCGGESPMAPCAAPPALRACAFSSHHGVGSSGPITTCTLRRESTLLRDCDRAALRLLDFGQRQLEHAVSRFAGLVALDWAGSATVRADDPRVISQR